ncbi:carbohydrate kinase [Massilia eurypsychrophila]|uniref:Carbohydrate kinase n=1 Tax=Massilia eurypsychrophila TaxID=1485217 RepID=A0A2G8T901_9BURK|nr:carbohydrate kinase [Massilia eurypsychrophila]PIL42459.1 carbohydrate kinase [Massilia eurypsychrophila]
MTRAPKALLAFGEVLIDLLQDPADGALYHRNAGGAPANVAVGFARLGGAASFMGMLSTDAFGRFLHDAMTGNGVDMRYARTTHDANTALAVVSLAADGERSFGFYRPPAADLLFTTADIDGAALADAPWLHLCSNSLTDEPVRGATLALLDHAATATCPISFDVNWRPSLWQAGSERAGSRARVHALLPRAHLLKLSAEEWRWLAGGDADASAESDDEALCAHCFAGVTAIIVVTDGAQPVRTRLRGGGWTAHPLQPVAVVDSTAAGDAFVAGLLTRLAATGAGPDDLPATLGDATLLAAHIMFAARCGAFACGLYGAFDALPMLSDLT